MTTHAARFVVYCAIACVLLHSVDATRTALANGGARGLPRGFCRLDGPVTDKDYIVVSNFPDPDSDTGFLVAARSRVRFTRVFENMYTGTGFGNSTLADQSVNVPVHLLAMFDPRRCVLSGSGYSFDVRVNDVFSLTVYPDTMSGPYASLINETVVFTRFGRFDFTVEE